MPNPGDEGTCFEFRDSVDAEFDPSSGTARRVFTVGQTEITPVMPLGFPNFGEVHPRYPGLFCDKVGVQERLGPTMTRMYALYSTNGRFTTVLRRPGIDLVRGYLRIDPERGEVSVPFLVATTRRVPMFTSNAQGQRVQTENGRTWEWINLPRKSVYYRTVWSRSVDVLNLDQSARDYITSQTGQIHKFPDNNFYMMLAPSMTQKTAQQGNSVYTIAYQWVTEPTLPIPGLPAQPGDEGFPLPSSYTIPPIVLENYYVTSRYPRPPFYNYQVIPGAYEYTDAATGIVFGVPDVYVVDGFPDKRTTLLGWQTLPGGPLDDL